jgi:SAM-dependent methyltransferase
MSEAPTERGLGDQSYFLAGWRIYRKVLDLNYMTHREVCETLREAVSAAPAGFAFLDIACGDAAGTAQALAGSGVGRYTGIDISRPALDIAARELEGLGCPVTLIERDLRAALAAWSDPVDVAWLGQSLHHFQPEEKRAVLLDLRRALAPGGTFMLWEPTLLPGEDRHGWLGRLEARRPHWPELDDAEWGVMYDQCAASDFPETEADWLAMAHDAGFRNGRTVFKAPAFINEVFRFDG